MRSAVLRWVVVGIVAIGMIAHTAALVGHNGVMLSKALSAGSIVSTGDANIAALEADLSRSICHQGGGGGHLPGSSVPGGLGVDCPVCTGLVCAYGLAPHVVLALPVRPVARLIVLPPTDQRVTRLRLVRPPSRGPPSLA